MRLERTVLQLAVQAICAAGALILLSHWPWQVAAGRSLQPAPNLKWPIVTQRPPTHIIGGNPSDPCKWPWHVALLKTDGSFLCGATLIYRNWVLTAGHCLYGKPPDIPIYAALGAHNLSANDEHQLIPVTTIKIHAGYDPNEYGVNDLALLELAEPANLSHPCIEAIALAQSTFDPVFTGNCWMVGWGMNSYDDGDYSEVPLEVQATVITNQNCQRRWSRSLFFSPTIYSYNVCTYERENYTSSCAGDSGSPLQCFDETYEGGSWVLVGIQSWGSGSCKVYPSVFMRASNYTSWIRRNVVIARIRDREETTTIGPR